MTESTAPFDCDYAAGVIRRELDAPLPSTLGVGCCPWCGASWGEHKDGECPEWALEDEGDREETE